MILQGILPCFCNIMNMDASLPNKYSVGVLSLIGIMAQRHRRMELFVDMH